MIIVMPIKGSDAETSWLALHDLDGKAAITRVIEGLHFAVDEHTRFVFIVRDDDYRQHNLEEVFKNACADKCPHQVVRLPHNTLGAVCSVMASIDLLDADEEIIIVNSDQIMDADLSEALTHFRKQKADAGLITFTSSHPHYSYVWRDQQNAIVEIAEKKTLSTEAIAGFYYYAQAATFIETGQKILLGDIRVNGSFYLSQTFNELVLDNRPIATWTIASEDYHSLRNEEKLEQYAGHLRGTDETQPQHPVMVIPMAGDGTRFQDAGYDLPKPFIDVGGKPMIIRVLENLQYRTEKRPVLIARPEHLDQVPDIHQKLKEQGVVFVPVDSVTEGAACTVLLASEHIDRDAPLILANCDQIVDFDVKDFYTDCVNRNLDGSILCFEEPDRNPKWSYARLGEDGLVCEVKEKQAISELATVGIYLFMKGSYFADAAVRMIAENDRVNNEFYVCPVYNHALKLGCKVGVYTIPRDAMHGMGTPEDLDKYLSQNPVFS